jgi:subtilisin-like proprotein convertase family protein
VHYPSPNMKLVILLLLFISISLAAEWAVELAPGIDPTEFAKEHHLIHERALPHLGDSFHLFSETAHSTRNVLRDAPSVRWAEEQAPRMQYKRIQTDPLYPNQWHLHSHAFAVDSNVYANVTGLGIVIAIVDDGLERAHPDIAANYDHTNSWDYNDNGPDPSPRDSRDAHGTAAAGVAAACGFNGHCGRGVAYEARVAGIRAIAGPISDAVESEALTRNGVAGVDIFSCSWGPQDDGENFGMAGYLVRNALARYVGAKHGRLGKGSIYVWAAGNGRHSGDSCAYDGYANSPYVIPVGAIDHTGVQTWYSEGCAALMGVTPSSGANRGITTVDLTGSSGYTPTDCTDSFGGTSAAAPMAAGIIALILQERPELTWRDVKHILARGATVVDPADGDWSYNSAGFHHSHRYGFGLFKVPALLQVARRHELLPAQQEIIILPEVIFPNANGALPFCHTFTITHHEHMRSVEHVMVKMNVLHPDRGNVQVTLTSPEHVMSMLGPARPNDHNADYPSEGWTFSSVRHWGERTINGDWVLNVTEADTEKNGHGTVTRVQFYLFGY